jgi:hypothetical protein
VLPRLESSKDLFIPKEKYLNAFSSYKANFEAEKEIYWQ